MDVSFEEINAQKQAEINTLKNKNENIKLDREKNKELKIEENKNADKKGKNNLKKKTEIKLEEDIEKQAPVKEIGLGAACDQFLIEDTEGRSDSFMNLKRAIESSTALIDKLKEGSKVKLKGKDLVAMLKLSEAALTYVNAHEGKKNGIAGERYRGALKIYDTLNDAVERELSNDHINTEIKNEEVRQGDIAKAKKNVTRLAPYYFKMSLKIGKDIISTDAEKLRMRWNILKSCERDIRICISKLKAKDITPDIEKIIEEYRLLRNRVMLVKRADRNAAKAAFTRKNTALIRNRVRFEMGNIPEEEAELAETEKDGLNKNQIAALSKIDTWVVRNFHNGGVAALFGAATDRSNMVNRLMSMPRRKRLFIYYLVESKDRLKPGLESFGTSQIAYIPKLEIFKKQMIQTKWKVYSRLNGSYIYWNKLEEAMKIADKSNALIKAASSIYTDKTAKAEKNAKAGKADKKVSKQTEMLQNLLDDLTSAHALLKEEEELRQTIAIKQNNDVDVKGDISKLHSLTRKHNLMKVTLRDDFDKLIEIKGNIETLKGKEYKKAVDVQTYMTGIPGHIKTADDVGITVAQLGFSVEKTDEILKAFDSGSKGLGVISSALGIVFTIMALSKSNSLSWHDTTDSVVGIFANVITGVNAGAGIASGLFGVSNSATEFLTGTLASNVVVGAGTAVAAAKTVSHMRNGYHRKNASKLVSKMNVPDRYADNLVKLNRHLGFDQKISTTKNLVFASATIAVCAFIPPLMILVGSGAAVTALVEKKILSRRAKVKQRQLVDDFFNVDGLVADIKKNMGRELSATELDEIKSQVRKRVAQEAGFTSVKTASAYIASRYAAYLLDGAHNGGENAETYIQLIKGLGLYYRYDKDNPKNNRPAIPDMVKKMCF